MNNTVICLASVMFLLVSCDQTSGDKKEITTDMMTYPVKNISVSINRPADEVYQFASNPENFPKWVAFIRSVSKQGDLWIGKTDQGDIQIKWPAPNAFGIIDHQVTFANGETVDNPMRIIANNKGCELVFTLFRMPGKTQAEFEEDSKLVTADLQTLKETMEKTN